MKSRIGLVIMAIMTVVVTMRASVWAGVNARCISGQCPTGDTSNLTPFILICAIALVVVLILIAVALKKKKAK